MRSLNTKEEELIRELGRKSIDIFVIREIKKSEGNQRSKRIFYDIQWSA